MMLPSEYDALTEQARDILRFMSNYESQALDAVQIINGTGMSERGFNKAMRRLVTRSFVSMDPSDRSYRLATKGHQAIEKLAEDDANAATASESDALDYDLCAVIPRVVAANQGTIWYLGVEPDGDEAAASSIQLILRLSADGADISTREVTLDISDSKPATMQELTLTPTGGNVRLRIEAIQLIGMDDLSVAGGMYFDVAVGQPAGDMRAIHSTLALVES